MEIARADRSRRIAKGRARALRCVGGALIALALALGACSSSGDSDGNRHANGTLPDGAAPGSGDGAPGSSSGGSTADSGGSAARSDASTPGSGGATGVTDSGAGGSISDAPSAPACPEIDGITVCDDVGALCQSSDLCCRCINEDFGPGCDPLWDCAVPSRNESECPAAPPDHRLPGDNTGGSPCTVDGLVCRYCGPNGPIRVGCGRVSGSDEMVWVRRAGVSCSA